MSAGKSARMRATRDAHAKNNPMPDTPAARAENYSCACEGRRPLERLLAGTHVLHELWEKDYERAR
jgi:hypothetical protein